MSKIEWTDKTWNPASATNNAKKVVEKLFCNQKETVGGLLF